MTRKDRKSRVHPRNRGLKRLIRLYQRRYEELVIDQDRMLSLKSRLKRESGV
jgi:hypothetical protein